MRRLAALLLVLTSLLGVGLATPAAADGPVSETVELSCKVATTGSTLGTLARIAGTLAAGRDGCDAAGDKVQEKLEEYWTAVWDSVIGDVLKSGIDVAKWILRTTLTLSLMGPSLDLVDTGLFERKATLSGMLVWLGWVIAAFGAMWQIGKAAITGQSKHWGQLLVGYAQNMILSAVGLTIVASLLRAGDLLTEGMVKATFNKDGAFERIIAVMIPAAIANPVLVGGVFLVLVLIGFGQMVMIFLRQSAIPIQCMLLPIAGAGLMGGDGTRKWLPNLVTSMCTVILYKPLVGLIICVGFSEFGRAHGLVEWLRGCATLLLALIAPGPLMKLFAPFGAAVGAGMAGGGMGAAANAVGSYLGARSQAKGDDERSDGGDGDDGGTDPVRHAQYVEQSMGPQGQGGDTGEDALAQASRNEGGEATIPAQGGGPDAAASLGGAATETGAATGAAATGTAAVATGGAVLAVKVLDGVNDAVQGAASTMGDGDSST
ncbi:hypothetical protein GCM10020367_69050 [Streptomyces sannanensis]|uniref:Type IV secretion system protein n=1 Tax=Streptomyces sannanensis TaxID=285536 RepID=A0ABP6SMR3_9ACTN